MSDTLALAVAIAAAMLAGLAVHEGCHYVAARLAGGDAKPAILWGRVLPNPAIRINVRQHTVTTYRLCVLAPLVVFIPSVALGLAFGVFSPVESELVSAAWLMWCFVTFPSPADLELAYHSGDVAALREGWFGDHRSHAAAEGIAA